ncbi:MAG: hypothetical protein Ct9H300mP1_28740 [Planctomycetaceae bacterium]|nr:MAG: hypothetical protein Ct9H300mP1_28740 [Planctomycetaceae bacterium]
MYRYEQSGELNGMLRVPGLTQDDAHQFCTPDQVEQEFRETLELVKFVLASVGLDDIACSSRCVKPAVTSTWAARRTGTWPSEACGTCWRRRVWTTRSVPARRPFTAQGRFHGQRLHRTEWQLGTVQLDYNLPERFDLDYIGSDNRPHRPVMIHRAPFGSMERFVGMLIEHFAGAFPLWLSPEQVRVLPISEDRHAEYAGQVAERLQAAGFRATTDLRSAKVQSKIRDAQLELIPYMAVVGDKEAAEGSVALRDRIDGDLGMMPSIRQWRDCARRSTGGRFARWSRANSRVSKARRLPTTSISRVDQLALPGNSSRSRNRHLRRCRIAGTSTLPRWFPLTARWRSIRGLAAGRCRRPAA